MKELLHFLSTEIRIYFEPLSVRDIPIVIFLIIVSGIVIIDLITR